MKQRTGKWMIRRPAKEPVEGIQNAYYERISERLGILQVIVYLSLFAFVILSFLGNTDLITYQNFYHFFKDLNASAESVDVLNTDSVSYPTDTEQSFTLYRQGLAVAGNHSVTAFTAAGRQSISETVSYRHPVAVGTGKYLLVYELGGKQYSLYNSYTRVYEGETSYPITGAAVSDSGMYALISSSQDYTSEVYLYNSSFVILNRFARSGYVTNVAINEKGTLLAMLTSKTQNGFFATELAICEPGATSYKATVDVDQSRGLACVFTSGTTVSVLTGQGVYSFQQNGKSLNAFSFDGMILSCADASRDGITVSLRSSVMSAQDRVILFDKQGRVLHEKTVTEGITQISRSGNTAYLLSSNGIRALDGDNGRTSFSQMETDQRVLLAVSESEILLCTSKKASYIKLFD